MKKRKKIIACAAVVSGMFVLESSAAAKEEQPWAQEMQEEAELAVTIEKDGIFSYREDYGRRAALCITPQDENGYVVTSSQEDVIKPAEENADYVMITGVGQAQLTISPKEQEGGEAKRLLLPVTVSNSDIRESDDRIFYEEKEYSFCAWQELLEEKRHWLKDSVTVGLSEEGKQYYTHLGFRRNQQADVSEKPQQLVISEETSITPYDFWCSNPSKNATTKEQENGMQSCVFGIDKTAPMLTKLSYSQNFYEPASTEQIKYYGENLMINGSFSDGLSKVASVEYTTQADLGEEAEWLLLPMTTQMEESGEEVSFMLELGQGCFTGIAVRATDYAGNQSAPAEIRNGDGEYVTMIVDKEAPRLSFLSITDEEKAYQGEWTNKPLIVSAKEDGEQRTLSGICEIEYQYVSIGGTIAPEQWERLPEEGCLRLASGEDSKINKNGAFYFRATTNAGVMTPKEEQEENRVRIRLQQTLPAKADITEQAPSRDKNKSWYNKKTGVPVIAFTYPIYDDGAESLEYGAPITIHKNLIISLSKDSQQEKHIRQTATKGIPDDETYKKLCVSGGEAPCDNLEELKLTFSYDKKTGYALDGIYHLKYWISDAAGNESEHEEYTYQIDTHEPENLKVFVEGEALEADTSGAVRYGYFYPSAVSGSASADFGVSGRGKMELMIADDHWIGGDSFRLLPCTGGCLYLRAEDAAGNTSTLKTLGVIVDNQPPIGANSGNFISFITKENDNHFYHEDVALTLSAKDMPQGRGCSALSLVSCVIGTNGRENGQRRELFSFDKALPSQEELAAAQSFSVKQMIDASVFEGNDTYIEMTAVDRCGNQAVSRKELKIDITPPKIEITFDGDEAQNGSFYHAPRTAVITVDELNFDSGAAEITVTKDAEPYTPAISEWKNDGNLHSAVVVFEEDGDYVMKVVCTDLAGNVSEEAQTQAFTIDRTAPVMELTYDNNEAYHEKYYQRKRTAFLTVTEHNFREEDFVISVEPAAAISTWTHNKDEHSLSISFDKDARYEVSCAGKDLAGNEALPMETQEFYIDSAPPEIVISGVANDSANAGEVNPVVVVYDTNCDREHIEITVTTGMGEPVPLSIQTQKRENGYAYLLTDMTKKEDNIYFLHITAFDMAENKSEQSCRFSLNRHGSAYDLTDFLKIKERFYNRSDEIADLAITEMNVDEIERYSIYLTRNGEILPCRETKARSGAEDEIRYLAERTGDERTGYRNRYIFYRENFEKEGSYRITCYSKDRAGNEVNTSIPEKHAEISFVVDNTAPRVVIDGVRSGGRYNAEELSVNLMMHDNFGLREAYVILLDQEGKETQRWDYRELAENEGDVVSLTIPGREEKQSLIYRAVDAAGNETDVSADSEEALTGFLITTNKWLQFISSPAKTAAALCALSTVLLAVFVLSYKAGGISKKSM